MPMGLRIFVLHFCGQIHGLFVKVVDASRPVGVSIVVELPATGEGELGQAYETATEG